MRHAFEVAGSPSGPSGAFALRRLFGAFALALGCSVALGAGPATGSIQPAAGLVARTAKPAAAAVPGLPARPANTSCSAPERPPQTSAVALQSILYNSFTPTAIVQSPADASAWYMVNRAGMIARYQRSPAALALQGTMADLRDRVLSAFDGVPYGEMGLLGMAMHPRFAQNGFVFVYYSGIGTEGTPAEARLARFVSRDGGLTLDTASEEILLRIPRTTQFHWGGTLGFGPDGRLYLGIGDGGVGSNAQNLGTLNGKFIRIDVDAAPGYRIPADNPFVGTAGARGEVWALGLRNPWKWSFDKATGNLWAGDVGATAYEEIDIVRKGANYGWPIREGAHCMPVTASCSTAGLTDPVFEYPRDPSLPGAAVIGGYVYSGSGIPGMAGTYVFADAYGKIFALRYDSAGKAYAALLATAPSPIIYTFFGDEKGEVYLSAAQHIYQLAANSSPPPGNFPQKLSETGCMDARNPALPGPAMIPYDVNSPLWSDGAAKERWFAIPDGTVIARGADGDWDLPAGSVIVKAFRLNGRLVETRLFVRHTDGDWAGYTYEWNDAQTDATLVAESGKTKAVEGRQWAFPSRNQCLGCHTEAAGRSLGLETAQLNRDIVYPGTGITANQLQTLSSIGIFSAPVANPAAEARLAVPSDTTQGLESRARSYLHANCAMCHRPGGPGQGPEDLRYSLPTMSINAVDVIPTRSTFGIPDARLIAPGSPSRSIVSYRIGTLELGRMPPLATSVVDAHGLDVVNAWIRSGLGMGSGDRDNDGFADKVDNCPSTANASQLNSDGDAFGNLCDGDFNNDGLVNAVDLGRFQAAFGKRQGQAGFDAVCDMSGDGVVNAVDLGLFRARFGKPVGDG